MRTILAIAILTLAVAAVAPRFADRLARAPAAPTVAPAVAAPAPPPQRVVRAGPRTVAIPRDHRGHFQVDGTVDGRRIGFMVDTGATSVALTERDAARLGVHPTPRDYTVRVNTANGAIRAAPVSLNMVEVGGVTVRNVAALVVPDEALSENLLGMSFLSRLRRFEFSEGRLLLEE